MDYEFKVNEFEGPLDLLLHLIKESKMDIFDIEIVSLTDQYLEYIEKIKNENLIIASSYLVMASELMYLKSRYLLPVEEKQPEEDDYIEAKERLTKRLLEYQAYKNITPTLTKLEENRHNYYSKSMSSLEEYQTNQVKVKEDIDLNDLVKAFERFLIRKQKETPLLTKVTNKEISIEDRRDSIRKILNIRKKVEFFDLFEEFSKPYVVVTFLSILEMAKKKELWITQENNFDKIYCEVAI